MTFGSLAGGGDAVTADASGQQPASKVASSSTALAAAAPRARLTPRPLAIAACGASAALLGITFIVVRLPGAQRKRACTSSSGAYDRVQSERRALHQNSMRSTFTPKTAVDARWFATVFS